MSQDEYQVRLRLLREHVAAAQRSASFLETLHARILPRYPLSAQDITELDDDTATAIYALFKKYEQLVVLLNDNILRNVPYFEMESMQRISRIDAIIYAEKIGVIASARRFGDAVALRNQMAHEYPLDPEKQSRLVNRVMTETQYLLDGFREFCSFAESRWPVWEQVRAGRDPSEKA